MRVFADSSTLVKIYADEEGTVEAQSLELVVVSAVSRVEVPSALWRKCRNGYLSELSADLLTREFLADLSGVPGSNFQLMVTVPVTAGILDSAESWSGLMDSSHWTRYSLQAPYRPGRVTLSARRSQLSTNNSAELRWCCDALV